MHPSPTPPRHDAFGELPRGIHHLGLTVPDLDQATDFLRAALGARWCYDGLTADDPPRQGHQVERQLGLPAGAQVCRQRMLRIGNGPGLELFEIDSPQRQGAAGLQDLGLNHLAVYCDAMEAAVERIRAAGGELLSEVHGNSRHEDTPGNGSVYARAPWGMLIELQTIPAGYTYGPDSEVQAWLPTRATGD
ncbi:VOC family protein [Pseudoxanthomonas sp. JBR18]|uniref:VOC family protein n=1 Tax=Pseudoxanthomonas sp. JBR18 TaxID=2969308 RepID=UPI0023062062|nr:VOC family protein [Pseudoxanthomonas sp. JBR18]WCE05991.1 VOC family protein [Pseudoxanthomonas sp. JBR18]